MVWSAGAMQGFYMFVRAVQLLTEKISGVIIVGLAGSSLAWRIELTLRSSMHFQFPTSSFGIYNFNLVA